MKNTVLAFVLALLVTVTSSYKYEKESVPPAKTLVFPVSGKKATVGSFWGAVRDGGKRKHEGIDIFARKGTPVVAVTDGVVASVGNGGRGGKYVWLRSSTHPWTAYYAHLDKQNVRAGQRVKKGQVIGTVGNTGNARTTPPHLHFGIYTWRGAINPYPYVKNSPRVTAPVPSKQVIAKSSAKTNAAKPVAKKPVTSGLDKKYVWKRINVSLDPAAQYYVTTRSNVVRVHKGKTQVVGKWKKSNSAKYPYTIELANKEKLYVNRSGKVVTGAGTQVGSVS